SQAFSSSDESALDLRGFGCVVAFGKDETLAQIRAACSPDARFIGYGSRASAGYVSEKAARDSKDLARLLEGAARDVVLYDSEGCMSLHVLFAEGESAQQIARDLSSAIEDACHRFPIGKRDASTALQVAAVRSSAAFRQTLNSGVVFSDRAHTFAVTVASSDEPPPFAPRCLTVVPVRHPSEAVDYLERHGIALEAFALSESHADLIEMGIRAGAVRLTRFGELQKPPVVGNHGGRGRITDFIRWIDREL
ncbi:MAG: hypothetical protein JO233_10180, partial [Candidatus Eremiobacteraeota bacterium]|nr:hypothetical protein [Candidatus Eremiobacteraeota bacterium]